MVATRTSRLAGSATGQKEGSISTSTEVAMGQGPATDSKGLLLGGQAPELQSHRKRRTSLLMTSCMSLH